MGDETQGFGEQLFSRLKGKGLSKGQVYKAITFQRLSEEVSSIAAQGPILETALLEIAKIQDPGHQKQIAEIAVHFKLSTTWVKNLSKLIRLIEKAPNDRQASLWWDLYFKIKDGLEREGPSRELLRLLRESVKGETEKSKGGKPTWEAAPERKLTDFKKLDLQLGRGLDVGTVNICCAVQPKDGPVVYNIQRNAFLDIRSDPFTKKMLHKLGIDYIVQADKGYVIGDPAFELANIFEKNTRRPMKDGMISPLEPEGLLIVSLLIAQLLGAPQKKNEICCFSVPADPIDADRNVIYHRAALEAVLKKLEYWPKPMTEGLAVVYAELTEEKYTGVGISCGGGMFNVCVAYRALPVLTLSTSRGGDWIDNNVAANLGMPASQVCAVKERGFNLLHPQNRIEEALAVYYRHLIQNTLQLVRDRLQESGNIPNIREPIILVCAGGTSMIQGFIDVFREEFQKIEFPIEVKEVRLARDPLHAVARGCFQAAIEETRVLETQDLPSRDVVSVQRAEVTRMSDISESTRRLMKQRDEDGGGLGRQEGVVVGKMASQAPASTNTAQAKESEKVVGRLPEVKTPPLRREVEEKVIGKLPSLPTRDAATEERVVGRLPDLKPVAGGGQKDEGRVVGKLPTLIPAEAPESEPEELELEPVDIREDEPEPLETLQLEEVKEEKQSVPISKKKHLGDEDDREDLPLIS